MKQRERHRVHSDDKDTALSGKSTGGTSFLTNVFTLDLQFGFGHIPCNILTPLALFLATGSTRVTLSRHRTQYARIVLGVLLVPVVVVVSSVELSLFSFNSELIVDISVLRLSLIWFGIVLAHTHKEHTKRLQQLCKKKHALAFTP